MAAAWPLVLAATLAFVSTNVDDLFVLLVLHGQRMRPASIVVGQYVGFGAIVAVSLVVAAGALLLRPEWVGFLGLAPIAVGVKMLLAARGRDREPARPASAARGALAVAAVTFANGGDNVAVYVPLFARRGWGETAAILAVFAVMVGVWCLLAGRLARMPLVAPVLDRWGHRIAPMVLMALGVYLFVSEGAVACIARWLGR